MPMSKQEFIALADAIREHNARFKDCFFSLGHLYTLADFCAMQNERFNRERWLAYIAGDCGSDGGKRKRKESPPAEDMDTRVLRAMGIERKE